MTTGKAIAAADPAIEREGQIGTWVVEKIFKEAVE